MDRTGLGEGGTDPFKRAWVRNVLSALAVAAIGFVLLGLTFLFNYLFFVLIDLFMPRNPEFGPQWFPALRHVLFLVVIALISWVVFRLKVPVLVKAAFMTVPTAVTLATIGILLYPSPFLAYLVGGLLTAGVLVYLYRTHRPWLYFYSVTLVAVALLVFTLAGGEI